MQPKVSIIVPVFNVEKFLDRCVQSVRNQTLRDIEIILVDDESPDTCPAMCDEYANMDSRIKVVHKKNGGLGMACNSGMEIATGEYIAFCDSDDWVELDCYEHLYNFAVSNSLDAVYSGIKTIDTKSVVIPMSEPLVEQIFTDHDLLEFKLGIIASQINSSQERDRQMSAKIVLYSRDVIMRNSIRFHSEREYISEDLLFNLDFLKNANRVGEVPKSFYYYFQNSASLTHTFRKDRYVKVRKLREVLLKDYSFGTNQKEFETRVNKMFVGYVRTIFEHIVNAPLSFAEKIRAIGEICTDSIWEELRINFPFRKLPFAKRLVFEATVSHRSRLIYSIYMAKSFNQLLKKLARGGVNLSLATSYVYDKWLGILYHKSFKSCGSNVYLRPTSSDFKGLENMSIGNNVSIPKGAVFYSTEAQLTIKDNVIFGPRPTIITGDHRIDVIGVPIIDSHDKLPENDKDVTIEEDVWVGANVVILKGVTIGRGSVVAAGAIVNKSCPPYSIIGGIPAKVLKYRFSVDEALEHESKLYSLENQYSKLYIEQSRI